MERAFRAADVLGNGSLVTASRRIVSGVSHFVETQLLWLVLGCYLLAAFFPALGLWISDVTFGHAQFLQQQTKITLPMLMLALLLLNAGLGIRSSRLKDVPRLWLALLVGLAANLLVPATFVFGAMTVMGLWLDTDEVQSIFLGLALIASMPIAGSSTAWSQSTDGNLVLSLGLVVLSTRWLSALAHKVIGLIGDFRLARPWNPKLVHYFAAAAGIMSMN